MSSTSPTDSNKHYHTECTGSALKTVKQHLPPNLNNFRDSSSYDSDEGDRTLPVTFFGACFCPFVQRVWIALEFLGVPYYVTYFWVYSACLGVRSEGIDAGVRRTQYYEVDPYAKPRELLEVSPKGLVPALKLQLDQYSPPRGLNESTVIVEYLEDLASVDGWKSLLPPKTDPYARALIRLQADHINRHIVPSFYRYLQAQDTDTQIAGGKEFVDAIEGLVELFERAAREADTESGMWYGGELGLADVLVAPWLFRATNVLKHYRGFAFPGRLGPRSRFEGYLARLFDHPAFKATCSTEQLYLDSYERYAFNRPNTSQVAEAINAGRGLP